MSRGAGFHVSKLGDEELVTVVYDLLSEISQEAEIEADAWGEGTDDAGRT